VTATLGSPAVREISLAFLASMIGLNATLLDAHGLRFATSSPTYEPGWVSHLGERLGRCSPTPPTTDSQ